MSGRKRTELAGSGVQSEFARRMRALRDESRMSLRQLSDKSGFSRSALSLAESGRGVPSWDMVAAFVRACGQDPALWRQLWEVARDAPPAATANGTGQAASETRPDHDETGPADSTTSPAAAPESRPSRPGRRRITPHIAAAAAAAATAALITLAIQLAGRGTSSSATMTSAASARQAAVAKDGTDPYDDHCRADQKELDWQPVMRADGTVFGTIVLMYSPACQAAWGYLDGPNTSAWTTHIIAHRIPGGASAPSQFNGNAAYGSWGNVLSTRTGCVCIEAYVADKSGPGPHARTACIQPTPPSVP